MNLSTDIPHKYFLNLDRRPDRRARCEEIFAGLGWDVIRHSAVDANNIKDARGFKSPGQYAHSLSTRLILRRAALAGADAVLILEDDVLFHPLIEERFAELELPADWGVIYLGCQHCERPEVVSRGLVRVRAALDTHAWLVRREYFLKVRQALRGKFWPPSDYIPASDLLLAELTRRIPACAAYPNLAWQDEDESDIAGGHYANYDPDGRQRPNRHCLPGLLAESLGGKSDPTAATAAQQTPAWFWPPALQTSSRVLVAADPGVPPLRDAERVAFLFLTISHHPHAGMWAGYWRSHPDRVAVYSHSKDHPLPDLPLAPDHHWLRDSQIAVSIPTTPHDLSIVQAQLELLKAALADPRNRFFIFLTESCVPVRPLRDLLRLLSLDGRCRMQVIPYDVIEQIAPHKAERAPVEGLIPYGAWRFHSRSLLLNREAAELLAANEPLLPCFAGTPSPDESAFGTILYAAGWPLEQKTVSQSITWSRTPSDDALHPDSISFADTWTVGEIIGSGAFFARKFPPGSNIESFGLHL